MIHAALTIIFLCMASGSDITCHTPINAKEGSSTYITCFYNEDLNSTRVGISVKKYANTTAYPENILDCKWIQNGYRCVCNPRFSFDYKFKDTITVEIKKVQKTYEGRYICQEVPPNGKQPVACELKVTESSDEFLEVSTSENPALPENGPVAAPDQLSAGEIAAIVVGSLLAVAVGIVTVVLILRRWRTKKIHRRRQSPSDKTFYDMSILRKNTENPMGPLQQS